MSQVVEGRDDALPPIDDLPPLEVVEGKFGWKEGFRCRSCGAEAPGAFEIEHEADCPHR